MKNKVIILTIYHYDNNHIDWVKVELFNEMKDCKQFVNKYFEQIDYENFETSKYLEDGFIINLYEEYDYTINEKEVK